MLGFGDSQHLPLLIFHFLLYVFCYCNTVYVGSWVKSFHDALTHKRKTKTPNSIFILLKDRKRCFQFQTNKLFGVISAKGVI